MGMGTNARQRKADPLVFYAMAWQLLLLFCARTGKISHRHFVLALRDGRNACDVEAVCHIPGRAGRFDCYIGGWPWGACRL